MNILPPILLIGGGKMGAALLAGWRERGLPSAIVIDPSPDARKLAAPGIKIFATPADIPDGFTPAAIILAVKPQMAAAALPAYARFAGSAVIISIMAGKTLHAIAKMLGAPAAIIRAMPNTPAAVRQGFSVAVPNSRVTPSQKSLADSLLKAAGELAWVTDEALLDPVTAISGGGPAYFFLVTELMEQAAIAQGIPAPLARAMARQTFIGSAALLASTEDDAATLRVNVTSPAGTTEKALAVLRADDALPKIFQDAIEAATTRSRELSD
jgi:pyrroline-5-carboxylate reductase